MPVWILILALHNPQWEVVQLTAVPATFPSHYDCTWAGLKATQIEDLNLSPRRPGNHISFVCVPTDIEAAEAAPAREALLAEQATPRERLRAELRPILRENRKRFLEDRIERGP
jgi:hypothetical protein